MQTQMDEDNGARETQGVRKVTYSDVSAILEIYNPQILESVATFEVAPVSEDEMLQRIKKNQALSWLVFEDEGRVLGYAYASRHRDRAAYLWCCEVSVYVAPSEKKKGIGRALYTELLRDLKSRGWVHAYAGITLPNPESVGFHEAMGFKRLAVYPKIGFKLGAWHDVGWWSYELNPPLQAPQEPLFQKS